MFFYLSLARRKKAEDQEYLQTIFLLSGNICKPSCAQSGSVKLPQPKRKREMITGERMKTEQPIQRKW